MTVTKEQAEAALVSVKEQFKGFLELGYPEPVLREQFDWASPGRDGEYPWAIAWEEGPYEWAYAAVHGGFADEVKVGEASGWPEGIWAEPVNTWSVSLWPTD